MVCHLEGGCPHQMTTSSYSDNLFPGHISEVDGTQSDGLSTRLCEKHRMIVNAEATSTF